MGNNKYFKSTTLISMIIFNAVDTLGSSLTSKEP